MMLDKLKKAMGTKASFTLGGVADGFDAHLVSDIARLSDKPLLHIARDARRMDDLARGFSFFAPDIPVLTFPAWDCLPYDRLSPQSHIMAARMAVLAQLESGVKPPLIILTTVTAIMQKLPPRAHIAQHHFAAKSGDMIARETLIDFLTTHGYVRATMVMEAGDFAIRGNIIDLFPSGALAPIRLDLFGDQIESIREFDPETQRTTQQCDKIHLMPANEVLLESHTVKTFRRAYVTTFGGQAAQDPLYQAVSETMRYQGMEHWLGLFYDTPLETLFDYMGDYHVSLDMQAQDSMHARDGQIEDYFTARQTALAVENTPYRPCEPEQLYLTLNEIEKILNNNGFMCLSHFNEGGENKAHNFTFMTHIGRNFSAERQMKNANVFEELIAHITALHAKGKRVAIACWTQGSRDRLISVLADHDMHNITICNHWQDVERLGPHIVGLCLLGLETGYETEDFALIGEQDILGDRMVRRSSKKRADNFLTEATSLNYGDYVVHVEHGIGRFEGLETLSISGAPHDCLKLVYQDNARLFLPVENIELLSRYGGDGLSVVLDRLGGAAWQARKARLKKKLRDMADQLIKIAAQRSLKSAPPLIPQGGAYDEFCARFAYEETDDQLTAIEAVLGDLAQGRPMDRLICGDVGFGKTEIALRAAFIAAMSGQQVAVIAPTTLLVRQHMKLFSARFAHFPLNIAELSRLVARKQAADVKQGLAEGTIDIVIGTHALLAKKISFKHLGLLIVDEEQHFGVAHKERLKEMRADMHVLTLTATPIPRTLQMSLNGVRDLSLIATPPVDRLAVHTFISPFDAVVMREALLREKYRAGQSFFIVPRIADLDEVVEFLQLHVPEVKFITAHGQLAAGDLEDRMAAFYDGHFDVLISTSIIESGLDIPTANTIIIHKADMFGLAQLYQMRGRVGRSKVRAYAYLTYVATKILTPAAQKRLDVLQSLDRLGAGFNLASHDLDLRGAGNLLGEEQSGQIREVGFELYQSMLEEAIANQQGELVQEAWSPQINIGLGVLIPETYVRDLEIRMGLYRRLSTLQSSDDINAFGAELIDRFGELPKETDYLLRVVVIKNHCYRANIEKIDAGDKGAVIRFRQNNFANPQGLIAYLDEAAHTVKLRADHHLVVKGKWMDETQRLKEIKHIVEKLAHIAHAA